MFQDRKELIKPVDVLKIFLMVSFIFGGMLFFQTVKRKKVLERFLDEEHQRRICRLCFYDHSFKKETLEELEKIKIKLHFQMSEVANDQSKLSFFGSNHDNRFKWYECRYEQIKRLQEKIATEEYVKELMILDPTERHLDDWDLF